MGVNEQLVERAQAGDESAKETLLRTHEPLVLHVVLKYAEPKSGNFDDLKQEGVIALWRAIMAFDADRGVKFGTYAFDCIEHGVLGALRAGSLIHVPRINEGEACELTVLKRRARNVGSLDAPFRTFRNSTRYDGEATLHDQLMSDVPSPAASSEDGEEKFKSSERYERYLRSLHPRERDVVQSRISGRRFQEIADDLGITKQRTHQIWMSALTRLRRLVKEPRPGIELPAEQVMRTRVLPPRPPRVIVATTIPKEGDCRHPKFKRHGYDRHGRQRLRCVRCGKTRLGPDPNPHPFYPMRISVDRAMEALNDIQHGVTIRKAAKRLSMHRDTVTRLLKMANVTRRCRTCGNKITGNRFMYCSDECHQWKLPLSRRVRTHQVNTATVEQYASAVRKHPA